MRKYGSSSSVHHLHRQSSAGDTATITNSTAVMTATVAEGGGRTARKRRTTAPSASTALDDDTVSPTPRSSSRTKRPRAEPSTSSQPPFDRKAEEKDDEEKELEAFLFAGTLAPASLPFGLESLSAPSPTSDQPDDAAALTSSNDVDSLFVIDTEGNAAAAAPASAVSPAPRSVTPAPASGAVWFDPDDLRHRIDISAQPRLRKLRHAPDERSITAADYQQRLRSVFTNLHHAPTWARSRHTPDDPSSAALTSSRGVRRKDTGRLPSGHLDIQALKDANFQDPAQGVVHAVQWHPTAPILMTAGMDCHVRLFSIDGHRNHTLLSLHLPAMPIQSAAFLRSASTIIATGRRRFFHLIDTATGSVTRISGVRGREERSWERCVATVHGDYAALLGDGGFVSVVDGRSGQWVGGVKGGATVRAGAWRADGTELWTAGDDEDVYVWDMRTRTCREKRSDPASLHNTAIALSPPASTASHPLVAVGSLHGIVSLYPSTPLPSLAARPVRTLTSLTTGVDRLSFNSTGELLASASRRQQDALSLYHVESGAVVRNWPTGRTPLHYVSAMDFSPQSGYFAVGNDRGRVLMYRIKHYATM